ncbi:MAG: DnaB-like helicase C-terminal domain-containing protein [Anaerolineae bacterium]|nr:DnaB-like helicase C-terminal domain-containing protein [Anaerolineae bacterium]
MNNDKPTTERQYQGWAISAALKKPAYRLHLLKRCRSEDFAGQDRVLYEGLAGQDTHGKFDILAFLKAIGEAGQKRMAEIDGEFLMMPSDETIFEGWVDTILENSQKRNAAARLQHAIDRIKQGNSVEAVYGELALSMYEDRQRISSDVVPISSGVDRALATLKVWEAGDPYVDCVPTGFAKIDRKLGGLMRKNLTTVGARPGAGKTQWVIQVARNVALWARSRKRDSVVVIFSAEMSLEQLTMRLASCASGVPTDALKENTATPEQKAQFRAALEFMRDLPIVVDETPSPTTAQMFIRVAVESMLHKDGVDLVIFDYLELAGDKGRDSEDSRLGEIMRGLKVIAKCFNCPVIPISQLNREVEKRESRTPDLADLRGSGWIEALSQAVIFIMRPEYYGDKQEDGTISYANNALQRMADTLGPMAARFEIAKNRDGSTGIVVMRFDAPITRFYEDGDSLTVARKRIEAKERKQKQDADDLIDMEAA